MGVGIFIVPGTPPLVVHVFVWKVPVRASDFTVMGPVTSAQALIGKSGFVMKTIEDDDTETGFPGMPAATTDGDGSSKFSPLTTMRVPPRYGPTPGPAVVMTGHE